MKYHSIDHRRHCHSRHDIMWSGRRWRQLLTRRHRWSPPTTNNIITINNSINITNSTTIGSCNNNNTVSSNNKASYSGRVSNSNTSSTVPTKQLHHHSRNSPTTPPLPLLPSIQIDFHFRFSNSRLRRLLVNITATCFIANRYLTTSITINSSVLLPVHPKSVGLLIQRAAV